MTCFKKLLVALMVINSSICCMDLNFGKSDDPVNYTNDSFSGQYDNDYSLLSDTTRLEPTILDAQLHELGATNITINNYWYPVNQYQESYNYSSHDESQDFFHSMYSGNESFEQGSAQTNQSIGVVRKHEDEEFAPCKKQRLAGTSLTDSIEVAQNTNSSATDMSVVVVFRADQSAQCYFSEFSVNAHETSNQNPALSFEVQKKIIERIKEKRRIDYRGTCCNSELKWDDLVAHITNCHSSKTAGQKRFHCTFNDCKIHRPHITPSYAAAYYAGHTVPTFNACPKCNKIYRPSYLTTHYLGCKGDQFSIIAEHPEKYYK